MSASATESLVEAPWAHGFFQALRRLEARHRDKPRLGRAGRPADEPVRLGQDPSLAFAPATLSSFAPAAGGGASPRLGVAFFGLFGPMGPLPLHLTEHAAERQRHGDPAFARFADLFHHRLLSLFYRAWADAEPTVARDRPNDDRFARYLDALVGLGSGAVRDRDGVPQDVSNDWKRAFTGRLAGQARNPDGLEAMLGGDLGAPVRVEEFVGGWATIEERDRWRLGRGRQAGALGQSAFLGRKVFHRDQKFRVVVGPVAAAQYEALLPGGDDLDRVRAVVDGYAGQELDWDVRLLARPDVRQPLRLGQRGRLGYSSWLGPRADVRPMQDVIVSPARIRRKVATTEATGWGGGPMSAAAKDEHPPCRESIALPSFAS